MKTLKYEEVLRNEYRDLAAARTSIREFLERSTTRSASTQRSAICRRLPSNETWKPATRMLRGDSFMSFPRHPEIYPPMEAQTNAVGVPAHRLDEFPTGYSLAGCSPAWPASASPAGHQYALQSSCRSRNFQRTANNVLTVCVSRGDKRIASRDANDCVAKQAATLPSMVVSQAWERSSLLPPHPQIVQRAREAIFAQLFYGASAGSIR